MDLYSGGHDSFATAVSCQSGSRRMSPLGANAKCGGVCYMVAMGGKQTVSKPHSADHEKQVPRHSNR
jgi:hypothetical protein